MKSKGKHPVFIRVVHRGKMPPGGLFHLVMDLLAPRCWDGFSRECVVLDSIHACMRHCSFLITRCHRQGPHYVLVTRKVPPRTSVPRGAVGVFIPAWWLPLYHLFDSKTALLAKNVEKRLALLAEIKLTRVETNPVNRALYEMACDALHRGAEAR